MSNIGVPTNGKLETFLTAFAEAMISRNRDLPGNLQELCSQEIRELELPPGLERTLRSRTNRIYRGLDYHTRFVNTTIKDPIWPERSSKKAK